MARRRRVSDQIRQIEDARLERLKQTPSDGPHAMEHLLARVIGVGVETADMLMQEVLSGSMGDRRAIARYAGLTGAPDESGRKRREKGLTRSGSARVRRIHRGLFRPDWLGRRRRHLARGNGRQRPARNGLRRRGIVAPGLDRRNGLAVIRFPRVEHVERMARLRPGAAVDLPHLDAVDAADQLLGRDQRATGQASKSGTPSAAGTP
jgi:hypothetical protein